MDDPKVLDELGLKSSTEKLDQAIVIRLPESEVKCIAKIEAQIRGSGHRVTRSAFLRSYILARLEGTEEELKRSDSEPPPD